MANQMIFQRHELKYMISVQQREEILKALEPYMTADKFGHSSIRNLYYDTPDFRLIRQSLERPVYKEKLRMRSYGRAAQTQPVFVELKKKYASVVYKRRIEMPQADALESLAFTAPMPDSQIGREIAAVLDFYRQLAPRVFLSYDRDAFYAKDGSGFRLTFDENIRYRTRELTLSSDTWGTALLEPGMVLMELKAQDSIPLWMAHTLSRLGIGKTSFSKYGAAYMQMRRGSTKGVPQYA